MWTFNDQVLCAKRMLMEGGAKNLTCVPNDLINNIEGPRFTIEFLSRTVSLSTNKCYSGSIAQLMRRDTLKAVLCKPLVGVFNRFARI